MTNTETSVLSLPYLIRDYSFDELRGGSLGTVTKVDLFALIMSWTADQALIDSLVAYLDDDDMTLLTMSGALFSELAIRVLGSGSASRLFDDLRNHSDDVVASLIRIGV